MPFLLFLLVKGARWTKDSRPDAAYYRAYIDSRQRCTLPCVALILVFLPKLWGIHESE